MRKIYQKHNRYNNHNIGLALYYEYTEDKDIKDIQIPNLMSNHPWIIILYSVAVLLGLLLFGLSDAVKNTYIASASLILLLVLTFLMDHVFEFYDKKTSFTDSLHYEYQYISETSQFLRRHGVNSKNKLMIVYDRLENYIADEERIFARETSKVNNFAIVILIPASLAIFSEFLNMFGEKEIPAMNQAILWLCFTIAFIGLVVCLLIGAYLKISYSRKKVAEKKDFLFLLHEVMIEENKS